MSLDDPSEIDGIGKRVSLAVVMLIVTGYCLAVGLDRIGDLNGYALLAYVGILTLAGMVCNRMPVLLLGLLTTAVTIVIHVQTVI